MALHETGKWQDPLRWIAGEQFEVKAVPNVVDFEGAETQR